jgi:uncharacterized protein (TIGR02594 family)
MTALRTALVALVLAVCVCLSGAAEAGGRFIARAPLYTPAAFHHVHAPWRHHVRHHGHYQIHPRRHAPRPAAATSTAAPDWTHGAPVILGRAAVAGGAAVWRSGSDLAAEAARYVGSGKFTQLPGAWCADAVSFWLRATGRAPLANRMAASALVYGPHVADPRPGDLVVMRTRRGVAGHVGVFVGFDAAGNVEIVSGNWSRRVARSVIPRWTVTAFVRAT